MLTMLTTRTAALSVLVALTLPACDSKSEPGDDAGDEKGAAEEESVEEGESVEEDEEPAPVADFGREGELCDGAVLSAACQIDGVAGVEFCAWDDWSYTEQWTACLTETCSEPYKERPCKAGGVAYCGVHAVDEDAEAMYWGICGEANECEPGDSQLCPGFEEEQGITQGCTVDPYGRHIWNIEDCNTPLVLSFDGAVEFSAAAATAADFAVAGGTCMRADWPTARSPWLALDRDRSGSIDGGHELFGSATRLSAGAAPHNGFQALAELDSDGDGKISAGDARWAELVLWADHDADRRSSGWEMLPLASFEIVEIDLGYSSRRDCDARGNCGIERAGFVYRAGGRERVGEVVDVRVACE
jgi:hypothetical protein